MKWINRKLKARIDELEYKIHKLERILEMSHKCSECGNKAGLTIMRIFEYNQEGRLEGVDTLLCRSCLQIRKEKIDD